MISFPEEIIEIIETIEQQGYQAYVVGGSVRDALLGQVPEDWDLASNAPVEVIEGLFPIAKNVGQKYGVVQVTLGKITADVAAFRIDGDYKDHRRPDEVVFTDRIEEDLARRDFTVNGMAYHPTRGLIDPFNGEKDLKEKLLRPIGDPEKRLSEDPLRILRGLRLAGQLDFDLTMDTLTAMQKTADLLKTISMDRRRAEFSKLLVTKHTGKALRMCVSANVMPALLGEAYPPKGRQEFGNFTELLQNIDHGKVDFLSRMSLFLLCFDKNKALKALSDLQFDGETEKRLSQALTLMEDLYFAADNYLLKRFLYKNGMDTYEFLTDVCKQHRDVYNAAAFRIESRYYILDDIRKNREPIYLKDLAITGEDLIRENIASGEQVGTLLSMLVDVVHRFPGMNTKAKLLKKAKQLKYPWHSKFRNIHLIR